MYGLPVAKGSASGYVIQHDLDIRNRSSVFGRRA
jgi:hypothetical protein